MSRAQSHPPPLSLSLHHSRHLSPRHTPYNPDHLSHRNSSENFNPVGPGQLGNFHSQYLPYGGSSRGDRALFSSLHSQNLSRLPSQTTLVNVDELSSQYGLDNGQRKAAHAFCKLYFLRLSSEDRAVTIFLRLLRTERQNGEIQVQMQQVQSHLDNIAVFCVQNWKPSPEQKLLKSLLCHYIIWPITSYNNLVPLVETYILDHAAQLHLRLYKDDPTVKTVVNALLLKENGNTRSAICKLVWMSLTEQSVLETFTKKVIQVYHLPTIPASPPQDIMACMALMRKVAKPLLKKDSQHGGDTGFWKDIEAELDVLFDKNGNQHDSPAYLLTLRGNRWEQEIIEQDNHKYNRSAAETIACTEEEIDAVVLPGANNAPASEDEEENTASTHEDCEVHISGLGDLAALTAAAISFTLHTYVPLVVVNTWSILYNAIISILGKLYSLVLGTRGLGIAGTPEGHGRRLSGTQGAGPLEYKGAYILRNPLDTHWIPKITGTIEFR
ncbi:hypothetical protein B0H14DRAFT_2594207 [Mycena olivaceomarginata]|nr:hypothetical protein B0H14DRAFT_2594207 [Mycena olivaceomarginata]